MNKLKYLWYTDTHFDNVSILDKIKFISHIRTEKPTGIILTGDIANGFSTCFYLKMLAKWIDCPIYFILGNHDYHFSSFEKTHNKIIKLCNQYKNLIWITNKDIIELAPKTALIGTEGWYDAEIGNPKYLKFTADWLLISDFRKLNSMEERIEKFKFLAQQSSIDIENKLKNAINMGYKTIYIATHYPPWKEATRDEGTFLEKFWLPYNVNYCLGQKIEELMLDKKKRQIKVIAGHTHTDRWIQVSRNIECKVNKSKYYGHLRNEETLYI